MIDGEQTSEDQIRRLQLSRKRKLAQQSPERRAKQLQHKRRHNEKDGRVFYCDYCDLFVSSAQSTWVQHQQSIRHMENVEGYYKNLMQQDPQWMGHVRDANAAAHVHDHLRKQREQFGPNAASPMPAMSLHPYSVTHATAVQPDRFSPQAPRQPPGIQVGSYPPAHPITVVVGGTSAASRSNESTGMMPNTMQQTVQVGVRAPNNRVSGQSQRSQQPTPAQQYTQQPYTRLQPQQQHQPPLPQQPQRPVDQKKLNGPPWASTQELVIEVGGVRIPEAPLPVKVGAVPRRAGQEPLAAAVQTTPPSITIGGKAIPHKSLPGSDPIDTVGSGKGNYSCAAPSDMDTPMAPQ